MTQGEFKALRPGDKFRADSGGAEWIVGECLPPHAIHAAVILGGLVKGYIHFEYTGWILRAEVLYTTPITFEEW